MTQQGLYRLHDEIADLLQKSGGFYATGINKHCSASIIVTLLLGQYLYKPGCYFVNWYFINDKTLQKIENKDSSVYEHVIPNYDVVQGKHMRIVECGCLDAVYMPEIRKHLRQHGRSGVSWFREKKQRNVIHPKQKGQRRDDAGEALWAVRVNHPAADR
jgi:hypothetical protein